MSKTYIMLFPDGILVREGKIVVFTSTRQRKGFKGFLAQYNLETIKEIAKHLNLGVEIIVSIKKGVITFGNPIL